jgi:transposase InsO family protein
MEPSSRGYFYLQYPKTVATRFVRPEQTWFASTLHCAANLPAPNPKAMELWAHQAGLGLNFIRPGKPVENGYIESFNSRVRDECLNVEVFLDLADARRKLDKWRSDYNQQRPHSALADRTPDEFASAAMQLSGSAEIHSL